MLGSHEIIVDLYNRIMKDQPGNPNLSLGGGTSLNSSSLAAAKDSDFAA